MARPGGSRAPRQWGQLRGRVPWDLTRRLDAALPRNSPPARGSRLTIRSPCRWHRHGPAHLWPYCNACAGRGAGAIADRAAVAGGTSGRRDCRTSLDSGARLGRCPAGRGDAAPETRRPEDPGQAERLAWSPVAICRGHPACHAFRSQPAGEQRRTRIPPASWGRPGPPRRCRSHVQGHGRSAASAP